MIKGLTLVTVNSLYNNDLSCYCAICIIYNIYVPVFEALIAMCRKSICIYSCDWIIDSLLGLLPVTF